MVLKPALLSLLCAVLLVMTHLQTQTSIMENRQAHAEKLLREMVGDAEIVETMDGWEIYRDGELTGTIEDTATRDGYNGEIRFYLARTIDGEVSGVRVTSHRETPGIGDGIDHAVSPWADQFVGRRLTDTRWQLRPGGDFDGLTGATITSRAMVNGIREALAE